MTIGRLLQRFRRVAVYALPGLLLSAFLFPSPVLAAAPWPTLRSDLNGLCLDIRDMNPTSGALLQTWDCWNGAGQRWYWDGRMLRSHLNFKCLDIRDMNPSNGALLQMSDCWDGAGQRWYWDGRMLRSQLNFKCLDIRDILIRNSNVP